LSIVITKLCSIIEVQSTPKGRDVFGRVKDGHIVLRGKVIYGVAERVYSRYLDFDTYEDEEETKGETLHFFNLFHHEETGPLFPGAKVYGPAVRALALKHNEYDRTYSRVGIVDLGEELFEDVPEVEIKIILSRIVWSFD
jgi:hypothetical protein